jgi:hypothetical protein
MKKEHLARWITLLLLGGALALVVFRNRPAAEPASASPDTPVQDAVYAMFDAAKQANVKAYVDAYGGSVRNAIEQSLQEQGQEKFAAYLREQTQAVKGIALQEPQPVTGTQAKIQVEYVYQDRNETQWLTLDRLDGRWKITRIDAAQRIRTLVPYGTPVN